jgi:hypothetical protein
MNQCWKEKAMIFIACNHRDLVFAAAPFSAMEIQGDVL